MIDGTTTSTDGIEFVFFTVGDDDRWSLVGVIDTEDRTSVTSSKLAASFFRIPRNRTATDSGSHEIPRGEINLFSGYCVCALYDLNLRRLDEIKTTTSSTTKHEKTDILKRNVKSVVW